MLSVEVLDVKHLTGHFTPQESTKIIQTSQNTTHRVYGQTIHHRKLPSNCRNNFYTDY